MRAMLIVCWKRVNDDRFVISGIVKVIRRTGESAAKNQIKLESTAVAQFR